jgi:hypothetical protein
MGKPRAKTTKAGRNRSAARDLAVPKSSGVKAGAVQPSYQVLPFVEQRTSVASGAASGRTGSLAVDLSDPS